MSKMLEQAIIDAEELKQAAMKIAEQSIIEKYSEEMKKKLDILLEDLSDPFSPSPSIPEPSELPPGGNMGFSHDIAIQVPLGGTDGVGENPGVKKGEDKTLEINFDNLEQQLDAEIDAEGEVGLPTVQVSLPEEGEQDDENLDLDLDSEFNEDESPILEENEQGGPGDLEGDEECCGTELTLNFSELEPNGYGVATDATNQTHKRLRQDAVNALDNKGEDNKEDDGNRRISVKLKENQKQISRLQKEKEELKRKIESLAETINKTNLINAKLLYVNKVLQDGSLNERQKLMATQKIADANSGKEAKLIYETLVTTTGERKRKSPESLLELKSKNQPKFSQQLRRDDDESKKEDSSLVKDWKRLAGIK